MPGVLGDIVPGGILDTAMSTFSFDIRGRGCNPLPKQSFKMGKRGGYTPERIKSWQELVATRAREAMNLQGQEMLTKLLLVELWFWRGDGRRVDEDNLGKPVLDAMSKIVYADDSQIVDKITHKRYNKACPGIRVIITEGDLIGDDFVIFNPPAE